MSERIEKLVTELTLDEKAALAAGVDLWHGPGVERLGVPPLKVTDGPSGARGEQWSGRPSANFPCGTALGATWNPELVHEVGKRLGVEARRKQAHALLAPTVNIHRHPLAGRNFECYSEDPFLSARMAVAYITGVQSQGVACTVKHFVANDSEFERMTISSEVDERTLREISLVPFEAAVHRGGHVGADDRVQPRATARTAASTPSSSRCCATSGASTALVMSDWFGTHSTVPAANAGLDLEMPGPPQFFGEKLAAAVRAGEVAEAVLDDKVHRVLALIERTGRLDDERRHAEECIDDPIDRVDRAPRRGARASCCCTNEQRRAPDRGRRSRTLAVIGPNADAHGDPGRRQRARHAASARLAARRAARALRRRGVEVAHERGCFSFKRTPVLDAPVLRRPAAGRVLRGPRARGRARCYVEDSATRPVHVHRPGRPRRARRVLAARSRGTVVAPEIGRVDVHARAGRPGPAVDRRRGRRRQLEPDRAQRRVHGLRQRGGGGHDRAHRRRGAHARGRVRPAPRARRARDRLPPAVATRPAWIARSRSRARADAVVCVVGTDNDWETEGNDRESMALPPPQDELVRAVAAANPRTVVVVNAASPVEMPWADDVARDPAGLVPRRGVGQRARRRAVGRRVAVGQAADHDPGAHRGHARVHELSRRARPGALRRRRVRRLPLVRHARASSRASASGTGCRTRRSSSARPTWDGDGGARARRRTPATARGAEMVQCYVHDVEASVARPQQELKAFAKVWLDPGESRDVVLPLDERAFAFWDVDRARLDGRAGRVRAARRHVVARRSRHRLTIERA